MLNFSNPSRSYDELTHGIRFWGYDKAFEISFLIEEQALAQIDSTMQADEAGSLQSFDTNLDHIHEVASRVYAKRRRESYIYAYTLTKSDC